MDTDSFIVHKKKMMFTKILQKMLKLDLILQIMNLIHWYEKEKRKTMIGLMKDALLGTIIIKFVRIRSKIYTYLIDDGSEDKKKQKEQKSQS